jgi:hypothetical protein
MRIAFMLSRGFRRRVLPIVAALSIAFAVAGVSAAPAAAASSMGYVTVYVNAHYGGSYLRMNVACGSGACWVTDSSNWGIPDTWDLSGMAGPCWPDILGNGNWNDCISSIDVYNSPSNPRELCVTAYTDRGHQGYGNPSWMLLPGQERSSPQVYYNDMISSFSITAC